MSDSPDHSKRLATIVAMDVAGYSSLVEADETGTLAKIGALRRLIDKAAATFGGRVFYSAGDGFMLEFQAASGALEAADQVRSQSPLPLRAGVHVGEVSVTPGGDLLGHGVNVAARLQARAPVHGVLASADVARAVRSDLSRRLKPAGRIKLDKMRETMEVFTYGGAAGARPTRSGIARRSTWIAVGLLAVAGLALTSVWALRKQASLVVHAAKPPPLRVAALPIGLLGAPDADLRKFAGGLQAEMVGKMSQNRLDVVSPDQPASSAAYAFGGTAEREGDKLLVRLNLTDTRQKVTVWSDEFRGEARAAETLQSAVASEAAAVAQEATQSDPQAKGDPETVAMLIKGSNFSRRNLDSEREEEWQNDQLLVARLPDNSYVHADLAVVSAFLAALSAPARAAELRSLAAREADVALKIDPKLDTAYFARYLAYPPVGPWAQRDAALLLGLKVRPNSGIFANHRSNFLREVGRLDEALSVGRQAAAPRPASANRDATLLFALGAAGRAEEAKAMAGDVARSWPTHPAAWNARLQTLVYQGAWDRALLLFAPDAYLPVGLSGGEVKAWTDGLKAMRSGSGAARARAAKALAAIDGGRAPVLPPHEIYSPTTRIGMIATLGDKDDAFAEARRYLAPGADADASFLFWPNLQDFRRDKRFAELISSIGLVDYWKKTGAWPDFCVDPKLPYDCKTLSPAPGPRP